MARAAAISTRSDHERLSGRPPAVTITSAPQTTVVTASNNSVIRWNTFDVGLGETVQFGALRVKPQACYTRPSTEAANTDAFVEVDEITLQGEVKRIFSGWMFAASPGLHGVEHPIYDIWLTDCKGPSSTVAQQEAWRERMALRSTCARGASRNAFSKWSAALSNCSARYALRPASYSSSAAFKRSGERAGSSARARPPKAPDERASPQTKRPRTTALARMPRE